MHALVRSVCWTSKCHEDPTPWRNIGAPTPTANLLGFGEVNLEGKFRQSSAALLKLNQTTFQC